MTLLGQVSMNKIIIVLDSNEGHITKVFTSDPTLIVELVDIDYELEDMVLGPYDPSVTELVENVDTAITEYIQEECPDYEPEQEGKE